MQLTNVIFRVSAMLSLIVSLSVHATELAGAWITESTESASGTYVLKFKHHDMSWTGVSSSPFGEIQLRNIVVHGKDVSFDAALDLGIDQSPPPTVTIHGTLDRDELHLAIPSPLGRTKERIARRVTSIAISSPEHLVGRSLEIPLSPLPYNGLAQSPPMGWNSWNKFGLKADDTLIRQVADALVQSGLRDAGYVYINVDDGWEGERDANGVLHTNARFPDMKALADYIHGRGLKFGIYSSPGPKTCGGFEGSYGHEEQDARMYAEWGVDYLKYDWCSADKLYDTPAEMQAAYLKMGAALRLTGRPIVYAICQYGVYGVGKWARAVGANLWRTTFDILDNWKKMAAIGFDQDGLQIYAGPGGWNDPDMLEVGNGGMSLDEYKTHFTLWSMLSAPLLLGNDVRQMLPDVTKLLINKEVIGIDQDPLGKQAIRVARRGNVEIWKKILVSGDIALAFFNRDSETVEFSTTWTNLGLANVDRARDLWTQADLNEDQIRDGYHVELPPHGCALLKLQAGRTVNVVFIGDSITEGEDQYAAPVQAFEYLSKEGQIGRIHYSNKGHSGSTTVNFLPSQGKMFADVERAATELSQSKDGTLVFSIMLGTNDSAMNGPLGSPVSPENYRKNLELIIDRLLADYPQATVVVHHPIWYSPNTYNGARYLADGLNRLESYFGEIDAMVANYAQTHPGKVFAGDRDAFNFFRQNYQSYLRPEAGHEGTFYLHPNEEGADILGRYWATAITKALQ